MERFLSLVDDDPDCIPGSDDDDDDDDVI